MLHFPRWKVWSITLTCLIAILMAVPSMMSEERRNWLFPSWAAAIHINLGLDLAGGSHLLLEAETGDLARQRLETMEDVIRREMRTAGIRIENLSTQNGQLSFRVSDPNQLAEARNIANRQTQPVGFGAQPDWNVTSGDGQVVMRPTQAGLDNAVTSAMEVARDVIDRRINALGTLEPTIIRQGENRIVVQVPGMQDPEALKRLIGRTARLEFRMVDQTATPEMLQQGRAPIGSVILPTSDGQRIAVQRRAIISGDQIADARQDYDQQDGTPNVVLSFDNTGGRRFARITQENVGRPFAIILDGTVLSYPVIREPILGGQATISGGGFTVQTANELAVSLRSGRLPVELHVIEERTVGPDLGADSIRLGIIASIIATLVVIAFMLVTYGRFGAYTTIGLVINALMILGVMAFFNATLTLPGIAGFVLTIGAAVDANVLINERIREEQRRGKGLIDALESGYREAQTAIFDANITNTIAAVLMFYFGSGPIRGFAVVLMIGIVTSVFTAVNVTRMMVALWVRRARPKELHI
jgi:preprotein translocase subunit SecD